MSRGEGMEIERLCAIRKTDVSVSVSVYVRT